MDIQSEASRRHSDRSVSFEHCSKLGTRAVRLEQGCMLGAGLELMTSSCVLLCQKMRVLRFP